MSKIKTQKVQYVPYEYNLVVDSTRKREKVIKNVERIVRSSLEYRDLMAYLREYVNFKACAIFKNISKADNAKIRIEIHHGPFTLYDIVDTVLEKWIREGLPLNELYIADEVLGLHYMNEVGLIPLSKTVHETVHSLTGKIVIPVYMFHGEYKKFMEDYSEYISDGLIDKYQAQIEESKKIKESTYDAFNTEFTYLEMDGFVLPQKVEIQEEEVSEEEKPKDERSIAKKLDVA